MRLFHRHKWTDWAIVDRGVTMWAHERVGTYLVQERYCYSCGKVEESDKATHGGHIDRFCHRVSTIGARQPKKDGLLV